MTTEQALARGKELHLAGDLTGARRIYDLALAAEPDHAALLFRIGLLEMQCGRLAEAAGWFERAVAQSPSEFRYHVGLGQARAGIGRHDAAAEAFRAAIAIHPGDPDVHFALGLALQSQSDLAGAIGAYREALQLDPALAKAWTNLGAALQASGSIEQAVAAFREAVRLEPGVATHAVNLGSALCNRREFEEAVAVLRRAVELSAGSPQAWYNLGIALGGMGKRREASSAYRQATELLPSYADAWNNLGTVLKALGEFAESAKAFEAAIRARPDFIPAYNNLGCLYRTLGRLEQAEDALRAGLALGRPSAAMWDNLGSVLKDAGSLDEAIACYRNAIAIDATDAGAHGNLAYAVSFQATDGQRILEECRRWGERHAAPLRPRTPPARALRPGQRLRIGYVSGDFREHCQTLFTIPLFSHHDHQEFEIFCYANVERPDDRTRQIASLVDVWRDIRAMNDAAVADLIRNDHIDVLVDLGMQMATARPLVFARQPAPVQVAWLAYPGTTGIETIGYRLTDPRLDPQGFDNQYTERSVRLPDTFWCYDPLSAEPVAPLPAERCGHVTFGCLNNPCKLTDRTLAMWSGVMRLLPATRLVLMVPPGRPRQRLAARLAAHGIDPGRVEFEAFRPRAEYLRTYHRIDIGLDTFPYNGHTTSFDAFWMGVPVVTRVGQTAVGRGGVSQLFNLGLAELAAESDELFVEIAVELARDIPRLAELRRTLRARMERSPLMDGKRFARAIEAVYSRLASDTSGEAMSFAA